MLNSGLFFALQNLKRMLMIITLTLGSLVALNFLLLFFSCNKTSKKTTHEDPVIYRTTNTANVSNSSVSEKQITSTQLAPTGS